MPTDLTTVNRAYQKPHEDNDLDHDVDRLIAALDAIDVDVANMIASIVGLAPLAGPTFTGVPAAPTATLGASTSQLATTAFVANAVTALLDGAPGALDTLNELAAALNDDANAVNAIISSISKSRGISIFDFI